MSISKKKILVVDGYNIINSWESLVEIANISLDEARGKLIDIMSELEAISDEKIILVFDSHLKKGAKRSIEYKNNIQIVYTEEFETADNYIERIVSNSKKHEEIRVATSDAIIQTIVMGQGATRISSNELELEFNTKKSRVVNLIKSRETKKSRNIVQIDEDKLDIIKKIID